LNLESVDFDEVGIGQQGFPLSSGTKLSSAIEYPACLSRSQSAMTLSSASTVS
jgi:hypothetical protein